MKPNFLPSSLRTACATWLPPLLLLLTLPVVVQAQFTFTTNNGSITITGYTGPVASVTNVTIPWTINGYPVTSIGNNAFYMCNSLTNVTIPDTVTSIGTNAFSGTHLYSVTIPNSVTNIEDWAFDSCTMASLTIGDSVVSIGNGAFNYSTMASVTIPSSVISIGDAFMSCYELKAAYFLGNAPSGWFDSVSPYMTVYYLPWTTGWTSTFSGRPALPWWPFPCTTNNGAITITGCTNISIGFPMEITSTINGHPVTSIGNGAFEQCNLTSVTIPNSVTNIGSYAFGDCSSLTNVTIGNGVEIIGDGAFFDCYYLTGVYFQGNAPRLGSDVFDFDNYTTVYYLPGTTGWGAFSTNAAIRAVLWNPQAQNLGVHTNQFGFTITGTSNLVVVVEACANLTNPAWSPVQTFTLTNGSIYFRDPQWTNHPARFYRLCSP